MQLATIIAFSFWRLKMLPKVQTGSVQTKQFTQSLEKKFKERKAFYQFKTYQLPFLKMQKNKNAKMQNSE